MKKVLAFLLCIGVLFMTACQRNDHLQSNIENSTISQTENKSVDQTKYSSVTDSEDGNSTDIISEDTNNVYNELAQKTILAYSDNSVVIDEFFQELPKDFIFQKKYRK